MSANLTASDTARSLKIPLAGAKKSKTAPASSSSFMGTPNALAMPAADKGLAVLRPPRVGGDVTEEDGDAGLQSLDAGPVSEGLFNPVQHHRTAAAAANGCAALAPVQRNRAFNRRAGGAGHRGRRECGEAVQDGFDVLRAADQVNEPLKVLCDVLVHHVFNVEVAATSHKS